MHQPVNIHIDSRTGTIKLTSRPQAFAIVLLVVALIGLCALPFTEYHDDYLAYGGLLFLLGLSAYYTVISRQATIFEKETHIKIRKGMRWWTIPYTSVTGGYTTYKETISRQSLQRTHFLNIELVVDLPDDPKHWIRNGKANIFHYGFSQWGAEEAKIWKKINEILDEKGIPNLTKK